MTDASHISPSALALRAANKLRQSLRLWRSEGALRFLRLCAARLLLPRDFAAWRAHVRREQAAEAPRRAAEQTQGPYEIEFRLPPRPDPARSSLAFSHSGNLGDIIYSLPAVKALMAAAGVERCEYLLKVGMQVSYNLAQPHPLGNVTLNQDYAEMLLPLLRAQPYVCNADVYTGQTIDIDLDGFRKTGFDLHHGSITRWYTHAILCCPEPWKPWLEVAPDHTYAEHVVINRTSRYHNRGLSYAFLRAYPKLLFVGLESEFAAIRDQIPNAAFLRAGNYLELASILAGARLFVGNQSSCFALAEGMKVPRILEVYMPGANVIVSGANGYEVISQDMFEKSVWHLLNQG